MKNFEVNWMVLDPSRITFFDIANLQREGWNVMLEGELVAIRNVEEPK